MNDLASVAAVFDSAAAESRSKSLPTATAVVESPGKLAALSRRGFDIFGALMLVIVFSPVIIGVSIALAISRGPVVFCQTRVGRGGRQFKVFKFRTMVPDAPQVLAKLMESDPAIREEWEKHFKLKSDPRVTPIGRLLRKTSLDELPQLWNVLKGDMGLIGPRPVEPFEMVKYGRYARFYYCQKPGLTGLWQVSGRSDTSYSRRIALDYYYVKNRSLSLDINILVRTVGVVLFSRGAY